MNTKAEYKEELITLMFRECDWKEALLIFAEHCKKNEIEWYLTGSACDAVRGIDVVPHDLDIEIMSKCWQKAGNVFDEYTVEPFSKTNGWVRDYFGRLVICNTQVDVVADKKYDFPTYTYEAFEWNGYTLWLEPFIQRYKTEIERNRIDRITAFEDYMNFWGIQYYGNNKD